MEPMEMLNDGFGQAQKYSSCPLVDMSLHLRLVILHPSQTVFVLSPQCCMLSSRATNHNLKICGLTWLARTHDLLHLRQVANHYTTDDVIVTKIKLQLCLQLIWLKQMKCDNICISYSLFYRRQRDVDDRLLFK
jgi:hypothetical protein